MGAPRLVALLVVLVLSSEAGASRAQEDTEREKSHLLLAYPAAPEGCEAVSREIRIDCTDDPCEVVDVLQLAPGASCPGGFRVSATSGHGPPALSIDGSDAALAAQACGVPDQRCFGPVPAGARLEFRHRVRKLEPPPAYALGAPPLWARHRLFAPDGLPPRTGVMSINLGSEYWANPPPLRLRAKGRWTERLTLSAHDRLRPLTEEERAALEERHPHGPRPLWSSIARDGREEEGSRVALVTGAPPGSASIQVYQRPMGVVGPVFDLGGELNEGQWRGLGRASLEYALDSHLLVAANLEGTTGRRLSAGVEAMALSPFLVIVPSLGVAGGLVQDVLPSPQTWLRLRGIVQLPVLGVSYGVDLTAGDVRSVLTLTVGL